MKGAEHPEEIPDSVAYELFLRTVADGNAVGLVKRSGLNEEEAKTVVGESDSFNTFVSGWDRSVARIKSNKGQDFSVRATEIARFQSLKEDLLKRTIQKYLPQDLGNDGFKKLTTYLNNGIKKNIQKVVLSTVSKTKTLDRLKTHSESFVSNTNFGGGGELYYYSDAWDDGFAVYGSGALSEQYASDTSYLVTVTVNSPSNRTNTSSGDWNYAPIVSSSGLSISGEDGSYSIVTDFEEQDGYYDEYGNFFGSGSAFVGESLNSDIVPPSIFLNSVNVTPNPIGGNQTANALATLTWSQSVPNNSTVEMELNDAITSATPWPTYSIGVPTIASGSGSVINNNNRTVSLIAPPMSGENPRSQQVTFPIITTTTTASGTVSVTIRIGNAGPSPAPTIQTPVQLSAPLTIVASPTPTPTPSPTATPTPGPVGGCNGPAFSNGSCSAGFVNVGGYCTRSQAFQERCLGPTYYNPDGCDCPDGTSTSPIIIDTDSSGYKLTDVDHGVDFDILNIGFPQHLAWTARRSTNAFLVLDRNRNGRIDNGGELFGNITLQPESADPNGFIALAEFDKAENGGDADGKITRNDTVFRKLRLWIDSNHNGISEPEELYRLPSLDIVGLRLNYTESDRVDQFGNEFRYRARIRNKIDWDAYRWAWDVFFRSRF